MYHLETPKLCDEKQSNEIFKRDFAGLSTYSCLIIIHITIILSDSRRHLLRSGRLETLVGQSCFYKSKGPRVYKVDGCNAFLRD